MKRILVIRGGAIGDFVLTLPAIKLLREAFPESRLEILGYKHIVALAEIEDLGTSEEEVPPPVPQSLGSTSVPPPT